jgi:membrane-bound ClpP family serine protease
MGIGTGIALFVIGAILAFAVNVDLGGFINLALIGYILMGAGVVVFIISLVLVLRRRRSTVSETRSAVDPASGEQVTRRTTDRDPLV